MLRHPFGLVAGGGIAVAFVALMSLRRDAWLLCVPALAPVVDLAGWSGAIHLTESDALVMSALLTVFSIANVSRALLEVDDFNLIDTHGRDLLANGDFAQGADYWFFSSDRHHLPWHAKNLWLHFFAEQGWLGLAAFSLLCVGVVFRLTLGRGAAHPLAPPLLSGLTAFFIVGAFDSLVDAPRLAMLAFLLMFAALGVRARGR